jgi:hypothetical protein
MLLTKKWQKGLLVVLAIGLTQTWIMAQSNQDDTGKLKDKVVAALKSTASGTCPEELMNVLLLDQCEQQLPRMKQALSSLGPIKEARYRGIEQLPNGTEVEVYRVVFTRGSMTWMAAAGPNGKLSVLWSQG